jgi:hypothetical protein
MIDVRLMILAASALLSGCVDTFSQLKSEVQQYQGQKIDALIDLIGYPQSQTFAAGGIVYAWTTADRMQMDLGPIQTRSVDTLHAPIIATASAPEAINLHFRCTLEVATDRAGTILHLSWDQKRGGCGP